MCFAPRKQAASVPAAAAAELAGIGWEDSIRGWRDII